MGVPDHEDPLPNNSTYITRRDMAYQKLQQQTGLNNINDKKFPENNNWNLYNAVPLMDKKLS
jgi:hypothetical protein